MLIQFSELPRMEPLSYQPCNNKTVKDNLKLSGRASS